MDFAIPRQNKPKQHTGGNPVSRCSKALGISNRNAQEIHKHDIKKPKSEGKGHKPKKCLATSNKKRKFEGNHLINNLEEDEEVIFLSKTQSRCKKARETDNMTVTAFLNAYFFSYT